MGKNININPKNVNMQNAIHGVNHPNFHMEFPPQSTCCLEIYNRILAIFPTFFVRILMQNFRNTKFTFSCIYLGQTSSTRFFFETAALFLEYIIVLEHPVYYRQKGIFIVLMTT